MAIDELRRTGAGFVAVHAQQVVARGADSGVGRLIEAAEELRGAGIAGAALADRIAGRAAVLVAVWANIRSLHAELISDTALEEAARRRLPVSHERRVPMILNRRRDGPCPFEAAAADALAQGMALDATVARLREVGRSMAQRRVREEGAPP
ncbi:MAG: DUF1893 domain-containing protein [Armatimonadota bacterium]|nr:DUF1893 domain-containing protein [Armatimonadota bacterium]